MPKMWRTKLAQTFGTELFCDEDQIDEGNEEKLKKKKVKYRKMRKNLRNALIFPTQGWESGCALDSKCPYASLSSGLI